MKTKISSLFLVLMVAVSEPAMAFDFFLLNPFKQGVVIDVVANVLGASVKMAWNSVSHDDSVRDEVVMDPIRSTTPLISEQIDVQSSVQVNDSERSF